MALAGFPAFAQSVTAGTKPKIDIIGSGNVGLVMGRYLQPREHAF